MIMFLLGIFFITLPYLPAWEWSNHAQDLEYTVNGTLWLCGIFIFITLSWLLSHIPSTDKFFHSLKNFFNTISLKKLERIVIGILSILIISCLFFVFKGKAHIIDAIVQLFQGKIFAQGEISAPAPELTGFFATQHMLFDGGRWYSQYAPGHSIILALGYLCHAPWLITTILSLVSVSLVCRFTASVYSELEAEVVLVLFLCSSFFIFMSASYMNHNSALFFMALLLYSYERWIKTTHISYAILAGFAFGFGCTIRSLEFLAIGLVLGLYALPYLKIRKMIAGSGTSIISALLGLLPYFFYNKYTTGDYFLPGFIKLWGKSHDIGFHTSPWGESHTPLHGIIKQLITINLLNEFTFDSALPALYLLGFALVLKKLTHAWDKVLLSCFFSIPLAYFFYWHRDSFLGPRYLFTCLPFLLPLLARSMCEIFEWTKERSFGYRGIIKPVPAQRFFSSLMFLSLLYSLIYGIPIRAVMYKQGLQSMKFDALKAATDAGITNGLFLIPTSWGGRIISNLRELNVPASLVEIAYRKVDHCELHELTEGALNNSEKRSTITNDIEKLLEKKEISYNVFTLNEDPTLRLRPRVPLTPHCTDEINYDRQHKYTNFEPHLISNEPTVDAPLLFVRDLHHRNHEMIERHLKNKPYLLNVEKGQFEEYKK